MVEYLKIYLKGACMGIADVIPGVSGGTIALILNIYERLITAIKSLTPKTVFPLFKHYKIWQKESRTNLFNSMKELDAVFLIVLALGVICAALSLSTVIPSLVFKYTAYTFSCFVGLIIPSIIIPWKMIKDKNMKCYFALIVGSAVTATVSILMKSHVTQGSYDSGFSITAIILFFSALIAISAMILPGISGSFLLMLMGQYLLVSALAARLKVLGTDLFYIVLNKIGFSITQGEMSERRKIALSIVENFSTFECFILLGIFFLGCVIGILLMSRVIHFCLKKSHDVTMAFLTGMICSSVYVLWPYKMAKPDGTDMKDWLPKAPNIIPEMNSETVTSIIIFVCSLLASSAFIVYGERRAKSKEPAEGS